MKFLIDMNLSPEWAEVLEEAGFGAVHWSKVGATNAPDQEILAWAQSNGYVVFTHDLDFGAILAATKGRFPSVLQLRAQDVSPSHLKVVVLSVVRQFQEKLHEGALISVDPDRSRVRVLPLR